MVAWVSLGVQLAKMIIRFYQQPSWFLILDDTFIYRNSKKAPGSGIFHQHGKLARISHEHCVKCEKQWINLQLSFCVSFSLPAQRIQSNNGGNLRSEDDGV